MAGMQPQDVHELAWAAAPRLSPDGSTAAFVVGSLDREENDYRAAIWTVPVDGSAEPRRFTSGRQDGEPCWSPDGRFLAFTSNRDGTRKQLYVMPADGGEGRRLTDLKDDVAQLAWSPDSTRISFTARVPDEAYDEEDDRRRAPRRFTRLQYKLDDVGWTGDRRTQLFVVPADGSAEPAQLTHGDYEAGGASWSPDGETLVFVSARDDDWDVKVVNDLYLVAATGGEPRRLTESETTYGAPAWSPDGRLIACLWAPGGFDFPYHSRVAVVDPDSGERRVLTADFDRQCAPYPSIGPLVWDGDGIVFGVEDRGNTVVYRIAADGSGGPEPVVEGEFGATGFDVRAGVAVHTRSTPTRPAELHVGERRLSDVAGAFCAGRELVEPERFTAVSEDGSEVDAWIVRPVGLEPGSRVPLLLDIHGGPFTQFGTKFFDEFQVYAAAGYAVVYANPRGSSGSTEAWGRAIRGPVEGGPGWGTRDYEDLMAVVDTALERFDFCDGKRLGVLGGSYGGYMTSWIVAHTDRFRAACSERSVNNLYTEFASSDIGWSFKGYSGAWAFEAPEPHLRMSPVTYADAIRTPLLIVHSENDLRCDIEQAEQLFTILRLKGREVELVRFPAEGHELSRSGSPAHRVMRFELLLDWFDRYLK